ncbi:MAG TPA: GNAT family N-acetyltransferase [Chroococcales cyanobacterium]
MSRSENWAEPQTPVIVTPRLTLRMPDPTKEAAAVVDYFQRNAEHLKYSGPIPAPGYFEPQYWQNQLELNRHEFGLDQSMRLFICLNETAAIVGTANFTAILRRAAHFCYLGYGIDEKHQGRGYMTEALTHAIEYAFKVRNLHRIMANYVPHNMRSGALLKRLGFVEEGLARDYLYLNGQWQDHVMTALTNHDWDANKAQFNLTSPY